MAPVTKQQFWRHLSTEICAVERVKGLLEKSRQRLRKLKIRNARLRHGDGLTDWQHQAPFDAIIAAAAPEDVPQILIDQLAPNGRIVMPVGGDTQRLIQVTMTEEGPEITTVEEVRFVPLLPGRQS